MAAGVYIGPFTQEAKTMLLHSI